jgi:hypothetical protein
MNHRDPRMSCAALAFAALLLLLLLPLKALADGKVMPTTAFPANVVMPDQQALIHFTNSVERLVIETRFTGAGTNFAWVVPLPSKPVVEAATAGLFPTLRYLFQPRIIHRVPHYYVKFILGIGFVALLYAAARTGGCAGTCLLGLAFLVVLILLVSFLPAGKPMGGPAPETPSGVSILDRQVVGIFDTTTIASQDPRALQDWLGQNGFFLSTNTTPVIASYVKDGWVFVAAKIRRDLPASQTSTAHPLSFTFKTKRPVYPMRLTGVDNGPLRVDLYVFGSQRASARHFKTERCTRPISEEPGEWAHRHTPETMRLAHPLLRRWLGGSIVGTKLTATLSPAQMRQDVWLDWHYFRETGDRKYSRAGARTLALNLGVGLFATVLFAAFIVADRSERRRRHLGRFSLAALMAGGALAGITYLVVPKIDVRLERRYVPNARSCLDSALYELKAGTDITARTARAYLADYIERYGTTNGFYEKHAHIVSNPLLGGTIREEDSPGNYTLRETTNGLEFVGYDSLGAEHVLGSFPRRAP